MNKLDQYRWILDQLRALPEERRMLMRGSAWGHPTDSNDQCGCVFGELSLKEDGYPLLRGSATWAIDDYEETSVWGRPFGEWARRVGLTREVIKEVEEVNEDYEYRDTTMQGCRNRYLAVVRWLEEKVGDVISFQLLIQDPPTT